MLPAQSPQKKPGAPIEKLTVNGIDISKFVITVNGSASSTTAFAASELQKYIKLAVGIEIPVLNQVDAGTKRILIDDTTIAANDSIFRHHTDADGLVIEGDSVRGAIYSVYHFLEQRLNWRFFASDTEVCYPAHHIDLSHIDYEFRHRYEIRDFFFYDYNKSPETCLKRYLNANNAIKAITNSYIEYTPLGIHNFGRLSETGGGSDTNPCLNDANVRRTMLKNLRKFMEENPDCKVIQVSQNDTPRHCQCEKCLADEAYYGAPSGIIVDCMNDLLEQLTKDYPDLKIVTFAYNYSILAPKNIVCHPNLVIEFAPIDMCQQHSLNYGRCHTDDNEYPGSKHPTLMTDNQVLKGEISKWAKICNTFFLYDYGLNCRYYYSPYPTINNLWENYQIFNSIGAWGYVNLSNPHRPSAEFGELRAYLTTKLLEDADMTKEAFENHINEFLAAFYGPGWEIIREFYDFIHSLSAKHNACFCLYNSPEQMFGEFAFAPYSDQLVEWFDKAEAMAETDAQLLHIRRLRIGMDYVRIGSIHYDEMHSGDPARVQAMIAQVEGLYHAIHALGVDYITEYAPIAEITDFTMNPREWGKIPPHNQIYREKQ